jgi:hypothetical protein
MKKISSASYAREVIRRGFAGEETEHDKVICDINERRIAGYWISDEEERLCWEETKREFGMLNQTPVDESLRLEREEDAVVLSFPGMDSDT